MKVKIVVGVTCVLAVVLSFSLVACGDEQGEESIFTTTGSINHFLLEADPLGALVVSDCVDKDGLACIRYPNPHGCEELKIWVQPDASTWGDCLLREGDRLELAGPSEGVPYTCMQVYEDQLVRCVDIYDSVVWEKSALVEEPPELQLERNRGAYRDELGGEECDPLVAVKYFSDKLNELLESEHLEIRFEPDLEQLNVPEMRKAYNAAPPNSMFCHRLSSTSKGVLSADGANPCITEDPQRAEPGANVIEDEYTDRCYCFVRDCTPQEVRTTCMCGQMTHVAFLNACEKLEDKCEPGTWEMALWLVQGMASRWLFDGSYAYNFSEWDESLPPPPDFIRCLGSPLVFDLNDDKLDLTSSEDGVQFDLLGYGPVQTAWVQGDDALLALDRNNNNKIDDGNELFGEALGLNGIRTRNGFEALALLDHPDHGGNADQKIDAKDKWFAQLVLWNDKNKDGVSQSSELRTLSQAGIVMIPLQSTLSGYTLDGQGNMLRTGSFVRLDGSSGSVVDVFFTTQSRPLLANSQ